MHIAITLTTLALVASASVYAHDLRGTVTVRDDCIVLLPSSASYSFHFPFTHLSVCTVHHTTSQADELMTDFFERYEDEDVDVIADFLLDSYLSEHYYEDEKNNDSVESTMFVEESRLHPTCVAPGDKCDFSFECCPVCHGHGKAKFCVAGLCRSQGQHAGTCAH